MLAISAAAARGRDAERVCELLRVEPEQMSGRNGRAQRADHARLVEYQLARLELAARLADPTLDLDALDHGRRELESVAA